MEFTDFKSFKKYIETNKVWYRKTPSYYQHMIVFTPDILASIANIGQADTAKVLDISQTKLSILLPLLTHIYTTKD